MSHVASSAPGMSVEIKPRLGGLQRGCTATGYPIPKPRDTDRLCAGWFVGWLQPQLYLGSLGLGLSPPMAVVPWAQQCVLLGDISSLLPREGVMQDP